jgi:type IV secretory pathway protease TraF
VSKPSKGASERRSPYRRFAACAAFTVATALVARHLRAVITPSIPRGLYLSLSPEARELTPGALVSFCPPPLFARLLVDHHLEPPGGCQGGSIPLAKRVLARAPHVCTGALGVQLNGRLLPWPAVPPSLPLTHITFCGSTPPDCLFVGGDSPDSIDSRSFGCVPDSSVIARLVPLFVETESGR